MPFKQTGKNLAIWVILAVFLTALFKVYQPPKDSAIQPLSYSQLLQKIDDGSVQSVLLRGDQLLGTQKSGVAFQVYIPPQDRMLVDRLLAKGINITAAPPEEAAPSFFQIFLSWFPMLLLVGVWIFFLRQMQGNSSKGLGFGKSRARLLNQDTTKVTFDDVAGIDEAKEDLQEVVDFLKSPKKFQRLGGRIPKGVLLIGPPGTGKTLLARAIAGEANVPFFSISGSDFVEMFVGVGASRVRDMFEQAKKNAPCIIFVDEVDAVGRHRGAGMGGGNDEREQTLNQLLVEMDGFESNEGIILIAATNRPDILDPALLRPGRFDRQITVPNPDVDGREKILRVHMKKITPTPNVDIRVIARGTPGFSGAELANLVNEAALLAARRNKRAVSPLEFEDAKDKVLMGAERRSMAMTEDEKKLTAYHEAGHALIAFHMPASDPIHKATIIPRGRALGMVVRLPEKDRISVSRETLYADIAVAMGGRLAEEMTFGAEKVTTGAESDLKVATNIARHMVTHWGMSSKLGPMSYADDKQESLYGWGKGKEISDVTAQVVDQEVRKILDTCYDSAKKTLFTNKKQLALLAETLLEAETLTGDEIRELLTTGSIKKPQKQRVIKSALAPSTARKRKPVTQS